MNYTQNNESNVTKWLRIASIMHTDWVNDTIHFENGYDITNCH